MPHDASPVVMNAKRFLIYVILVASVLLVTDLVLYMAYRAHSTEMAIKKDKPSKPGFRLGGNMKKFKRAKVAAAASRNIVRTFPINRTELLSDHPQCTPDKSRNRLRNFFGPLNLSSVPVYVDKTFLRNKKLMSLPQPFGFKDVDSHVMHVLKFAKMSTLPEEMNRNACLRCVVVGNSGVMRASHLGDVIDNFDIIIRMNDAPVAHYEMDVGSKTTIRLAYPESAFRFKEGYGPDWHMVVIAFKPQDLVWLETVIQGRRMGDNHGFWKKIAKSVPKKPEEIRLLHPEVLQIGAELIGFTVSQDANNKNIPTSGFIGVTMALSLCDEVSVVGFGYDPDNPKGHLHYYDGLTMDLVKRVFTHNVNQETKTLVRLVEQGIIHDLTGAIQIYGT